MLQEENEKMNAVIRRIECADLPNYYACSLAVPRVVDGQIELYNGRGARRSWGQSRLSSDIVFLGDDLIVVDVVGWHKFTVSPVGGRYYFVINRSGQWARTNGNHRMVRQWTMDIRAEARNVAANV